MAQRKERMWVISSCCEKLLCLIDCWQCFDVDDRKDSYTDTKAATLFTSQVQWWTNRPQQQQQLFYGLLSGTIWVSRYQKKHSPLHISWSSTILNHLRPSTMIHCILPVLFTCLTVFLHYLSPSPHRSASWSATCYFILHTFLHPIIVFFLQHMPIPRLCHLILVSLSTLYLGLYITHPSDYSRFCLLKCHLILFFYRLGLTSMQHTTLHTTVVQSPSRFSLSMIYLYW